jgi:hypothetical protein
MRGFKTWLSGPGFQALNARFQDLALRTWVSGPQREVWGPGSQDLGFRPSTRGFRTWLSGPGFQDLESSPSYGRLIFLPSLFSASSGHRQTDVVNLYIRLGLWVGLCLFHGKFGLTTKTTVQNYRMIMKEVEGIVCENKISTCQNFMGYVL